MCAAVLPTRDQCEVWSTAQLAALLCQHGLKESSDIVKTLRIDGHSFLNLSTRDFNRFHLSQQLQLQKMVQDIKNNDGSIINRLKRFQNEQATLIRDAGRSTWERLKNKGPPRPPVRDYDDEEQDGNQWSGSDFDSDTYEDPSESNEDSYEPPPSEQDKRASVPSLSCPRGEYLDNQRARWQHTPCKPFPPPKKGSVQPVDEEDYINPEEDDNYINPSEKTDPLSDPHRDKTKERLPGSSTASKQDPDVYEVPDQEKESCSSESRANTQLRAPGQALPPRASPRFLLRKLLPAESQDEDEYEVCDTDKSERNKHELEGEGLQPVKSPMPVPRELRKPSLPVKPARPALADTGSEARPMAMKRNVPNVSSASPPSASSWSPVPPPTPSPKPLVDKGSVSQTQDRVVTEQEAGVYRKPWYAGSCDRKTADELLQRCNKDGSYLVRKSSGQDAQQPYTLVVLYRSRVYNIPVRYLEDTQQYALGREKKGEERFSSISNIIENHQKNALVLIDSQKNTKDSTRLCHAVRP